MDWLGALIGAGGSLLGGLLGNNNQNKINAQQIAFSREQMQQQRAWALEDQREQFTRLRSSAEQAGFNPLTVLGAAPMSGMVNPVAAGGVSLSSNNYMGQAIAESSLMLADAFAKTRAAQTTRTVEDLNRQRDILQRKLTDATLRPKIPGVFGTGANPLPQPQGGGNAQSAVPSVSSVSAGGVSNGGAVDGNARPLTDASPVDARREIDSTKVVSDAGFAMVDNPNIAPFPVPAYNGEILDLGQTMVLAGSYSVHQMRQLVDRKMTQRISPEMRVQPDWKKLLPKPKPKYQNRRATRFNPNHRDGYYYP